MTSHAPPYSVRLDADSARELTEKGCTLLLLGVPENTILGIDQQSFVVGPRFRGVKMVPPGPHVVSYTASSGRGDFGPTTSFFIHVRGGQVVVRRWHAADEILELLQDDDEVERLAAAARRFEFDAGLGPYDLSSYRAWRKLSSYVTPAVISKLQPVSGNINILAEADPATQTAAEAALQTQLEQAREARSRTAAAAAEASREEAVPGASEDEDRLQSLPPEQQRQQQHAPVQPAGQPPAAPAQQRPQDAAPHAGRCFYTPLPRLVKRGGLSAAELTALNLDKSKVLEELLTQLYGGSEDAFLGEFQFSFLAFLLGQSLEGFAQWKAFLHLMFGCDDAPLGSRSKLFTNFLAALHAQLEQSMSNDQPGSRAQQAMPFGSPMMDELLDDSFLRRLCSQFFQMLHEERASVLPELAAQADAVSSVLLRTLGWGARVVSDLGREEDEDEDGPVVVELAGTDA